MRLAAEYPNSRTAYTNGKKQFIKNALKQAKIYKNSKI